MEKVFEILGLGTLELISALTFLTIIIVEVLKKIIPEKFPTRILTLIVAEFVAVVVPILNPNVDISVISVISSLFNGFIIAFISMNGFDSMSNIWKRLIGQEDKGEDDEGI